MKRSKKKITNIFLSIVKKVFSEKIYAFILYLRSKRKFKKELNKPKSLKKFSNNLDKINDHEFKITSQNNEDGLIDYIFSKIPHQKKFLEIGFDFYEFNSLNLIKNNWEGTLIDFNKEECLILNNLLKSFFPKNKVKIKNFKITKDNINNIVYENDTDLIDFFSLDVDGNDYWILKALNLSRINVVCCEYNHWLGKNVKKTIPYNDEHKFQDDGYYGASLRAINDLLDNKGFDLIAVDSSGTNAFFINKKFSNKFDKLSPVTSWRPGVRFYSQNRKKEIIEKINTFDFIDIV